MSLLLLPLPLPVPVHPFLPVSIFVVNMSTKESGSGLARGEVNHSAIYIQVSEFLSLFLLTRFVIPFPSKLSYLRFLAKRRTAASGSILFSVILLFDKFRLSTWDELMPFARCYTPESVILLPLRLSSRM